MRTDEVGGVVAVAEPPGGDGAREVDAVEGPVGPGDARPRQVVVVADVHDRGPEHEHRRRPSAAGGGEHRRRRRAPADIAQGTAQDEPPSRPVLVVASYYWNLENI